MTTQNQIKTVLTLIAVLGIAPGVANAGLIAHWPFDEGTGDVAYDVIGDNDGQIIGCTWVTPGKVGAAAIEGSGADEVNCGAGPTPATEDLTLAWWMVDNHASYGTIMDKSVTDSGYGYNILLRPPGDGGPLRFRIGGWQSYGGWGEECRIPDGAYTDGEWVHITCTYDSATDTATIYVNGVMVPNDIYNPKVGGIAGDDGYCEGVNNPDTPLYIRGGEETFNGILDEVAIWDNALTAEEVLEVYNSGVPPLDANLPDVDVGVDMVTWSGQAVALDANVVNNDTTIPQGILTYLWTAEPNGIGDPNLDVAITGADTENASVTITKTAPTGDATVVRMTLAVTLEGKDPVTDTMTIDVYDDACAAALDLGLTTIDTTDLDGNCITSFPDFAVLASTWLDDYALTEAVAK